MQIDKQSAGKIGKTLPPIAGREHLPSHVKQDKFPGLNIELYYPKAGLKPS